MQNMADMFGKINEFQAKMKEAKDKLGELEVQAEAGGGMVKVTANGNREIIGITIDKDVVDPNDMEMLEDLIVAGVNKALAEAESASQQKMQEITSSMLPGGLGGFDLSQFGLK